MILIFTSFGKYQMKTFKPFSLRFPTGKRFLYVVMVVVVVFVVVISCCFHSAFCSVKVSVLACS